MFKKIIIVIISRGIVLVDSANSSQAQPVQMQECKRKMQKNTTPPLELRPEVVCVKVPRELLVHAHDVHVTLAIVPHHGPRPLAILLVPLNVDAQAPVHLEPEEDLVIHRVPPPGGLVALDALDFELLQPRAQIRRALRQSLRLHLRVAGGFRRAELDRVEARNVRGVVGGRVRRREVVVLGAQRIQLAGELLEGRLGLADAQLPRLLEGRDGLIDARDGKLVWVDVKVVDRMVDELLECTLALLFCPT